MNKNFFHYPLKREKIISSSSQHDVRSKEFQEKQPQYNKKSFSLRSSFIERKNLNHKDLIKNTVGSNGGTMGNNPSTMGSNGQNTGSNPSTMGSNEHTMGRNLNTIKTIEKNETKDITRKNHGPFFFSQEKTPRFSLSLSSEVSSPLSTTSLSPFNSLPQQTSYVHNKSHDNNYIYQQYKEKSLNIDTTKTKKVKENDEERYFSKNNSAKHPHTPMKNLDNYAIDHHFSTFHQSYCPQNPDHKEESFSPGPPSFYGSCPKDVLEFLLQKSLENKQWAVVLKAQEMLLKLSKNLPEESSTSLPNLKKLYHGAFILEELEKLFPSLET